MKKVTLGSYKKDKYYPRVVRAVARILMRSDVVAPVEVLIEMGNLSKKNLEAWRGGEVRYLEGVFEGNLSKANRILRIIGFHAHDLNMVPRETTYRASAGKRKILRFSKYGVEAIERAYSRHYKWNQSPEKKPNIIQTQIQPTTASDVGTSPCREPSNAGPK